MSWSESDTRLYQELAMVAVPARAEQMATLLTLLPFGATSVARVVELGCGEGRLSQAVLTCYRQATVVALDGSADMLAAAGSRLASFGERVRIQGFDLSLEDWWPLLEGADAVVSSLAVHHLDGSEKQRLFEAVARRLSDTGALLIADLVEPQRAESRELFAAQWDRAAASGSTRVFEQFVASQWNIFRYPDPVDKPSPLFEQLMWLRAAGLVSVDCFWLQAAHAIYGGYRSAQRSPSVEPPVSFTRALEIAESVLG